MYGYPTQMPMMPLAHMMNNPMAAPGYVANAKKPDFPPDMQPIFVIPQIAHIKTTAKPKCRKYDPVLGKGLKAEWIMDKFEDEYEREEREAQERTIERPSRLPLKVITKLIKKKIHKDKIDTLLHQWNPFQDNTSDPYKTLFVSRLNYAVSEKKLRREFEQYGPIKSVKMIRDSTKDKPRGYAFVEFEHKNDMKTAYKYANGKRIEPDLKPTPRYVNGRKVEYDRRILVDIERGRTIMKFRPRRLGGTLGDLRRSKSEEERKIIEDRIEREREREYEALKLKKGFISVLSLMIRKVRRVSKLNESEVNRRRRRSIPAKKTIYPQRKDKHARPRKASMRSLRRRSDKLICKKYIKHISYSKLYKVKSEAQLSMVSISNSEKNQKIKN